MGETSPFVCGLAVLGLGLILSGSAAAQMDASSGSDKAGIVSEIRIGVLDHDVGFFGHEKESGIDGNAEVLFTSPEVFKSILSPRPHIGASINSDGNTSKVYAGLTWDVSFGPLFLEGSLGGALHDGEYKTDDPSKKDLGCTLAFREAVSVGVRFWEQHSISLMLDHMSNATLCENNDGLETFGVRYGYMF